MYAVHEGYAELSELRAQTRFVSRLFHVSLARRAKLLESEDGETKAEEDENEEDEDEDEEGGGKERMCLCKKGKREKNDVSERRKLLPEGRIFLATRKRRDSGAGWGGKRQIEGGGRRKKRVGGDEEAEGGKSRVRSSRGRVSFSRPFCLSISFSLGLSASRLLSRRN